MPIPPPRVLTMTGAARLGFTPAQVRTELRRDRWQRLASGVLLTRPDAPTRDDWPQTGVVLGGSAAVLSGWDAVRLRGLGAEDPPREQVLVLLPPGRRHRDVGGVRLRPSERAVSGRRHALVADRLPGVLLAPVARAVCDTALDLGQLAPVRALVTSAVQRRLCTPDDLFEQYAAGPRNGSSFLRRALDDVFGGAQSLPEAELADALRAHPLPGFELNVPILDGSGRHVATADVLWRSLRAVLEVDSRQHHFLEAQWRGTMRRHNRLTAAGLALTHYPPVEFRTRRREILREIETWLRRRAAELGVVYPPAEVCRPGVPLVLPGLGA